MRISLKLYRWLLKLYPASFREEYEAPLQQQFKDDYVEIQSAGDLIRFWARAIVDVARSAPAQLVREIAQDARHALRLWRRRPLHTAFAVAVLAVAIGANTGVFSVLNALLLRSLPFNEPERLVVFRNFSAPRGEFHTWRQQSGYLADAAIYDSIEVNADGVNQARRLRLTETSWNFFTVTGTPLAYGRTFAPGDDTAGRNKLAVVGYGLWQQFFAGDPAAIGASIRVNGTTLTIIGVAPPGFDYPRRTDVWTPTTFDWMAIPKTGTSLFFTTVGRLRPGITWKQAREAFELEAYRAWPEARNAVVDNRPRLVSLRDDLSGPVRQASLVLMAGVALLLLLACANIANLLLARTVARSNELMIRSALGASRARLTQQLLTESGLLSAVATVVGLIVAQWTTAVAEAAQPAQLSSQTYATLDWPVLAFALALSLATGVLFGVGPALYAIKSSSISTERAVTGGGKQARTRQVLIATQVATVVVLLTGSLALGSAFIALLQVDTGYEVRSVATMSVSLAGTVHEDEGRASTYYAEALRRVRSVPDVVSVSTTEFLPLASPSHIVFGFQLDGVGPAMDATLVSVAQDYFATIGARLLAGREFNPQDTDAVIVNEQFARRSGDPQKIVGRVLTMQPMKMTRRVIGVVQGMRDTGPGYEPRPQVFFMSRSPRAAHIVARVRGSADERLASIQAAVQSVDQRVPVFDVKTMDQWLEAVLTRPKFYTTAVIFFGGLALLLAIIGVYGIVSYTVRQRTREMGIRLALGTTPVRLRARMLRQTLTTVGLGVLVGVPAAAALGRYLQTLVQGADAATTQTAIVAVGVTVTIAAAATWGGTRHITRVDIADVLRAETSD